MHHEGLPSPRQRRIFVLNTGSTSTKVALADGCGSVLQAETYRHAAEELRSIGNLWNQLPLRLGIAQRWATEQTDRCDAVAAVGGLLRPLKGGVYSVNELMLKDAREGIRGEHASNLGCAIAQSVAKEYDCPAYVVDPVSVDEFQPLAYYSGHPLIKRKSLSHALNIHAAARIAAQQLHRGVDDASFVVAHLGGGISIAPVRNGMIIDVNDAASDGPFSPERTGGLPLQEFITVAYSENMTENKLRRMVMGEGGLVAYLGTNSTEEIERRIGAGDGAAREVYEAMAYQIAKEIGAMATVLEGRTDAVVLTGGLAHSSLLVDTISRRVKYIAPLIVLPGEDEMRSLALGAARVLSGEELAMEY